MAGETITIGNVRIAKGENKQVNLNIARLPSRTIIDTPVYIYRSKKNGPTLLLMGGMHGDEINGVEIVRQMVAGKMIKPIKGSVIAIPLLNVYGFINFSRQAVSGRDVNRSFPGSKRGSLASVVAYQFMREIFPHIDYALDFHTGGGNISNYPQIRCSFDVSETKEMGKAFGAPFVINSKIIDKSLRKEFTKEKKPFLVYEAGESLRLQELAVKEGIKGALRIMKYLGIMKEADPISRRPKLINSDTWIRATTAGMFRTDIKNGSLIAEGQHVGSITDPYGEFEISVKSPASGYIVGINNKPVVNKGDALIHIGMLHANGVAKNKYD